MKILYLFLIICFSSNIPAYSQAFVPNYDEAKIPFYTLPNVIAFEDGSIITNVADWEKRRAEILGVFSKEVYGTSPEWDGEITATEVSSVATDKFIRKEIKLSLHRKSKKVDLYVLLFLPRQQTPAPIFLGLNFYGNQTLSDGANVLVTQSWIRDNNDLGSENNRASEKSRGMRTANWPAEDIVEKGYGLASLYYGDVDPDFDDGFQNGVHALYDQERDESSWGSVAAWAWGLSRVMDYLVTLPEVDADKVAVLGHSRLGKAAIWAGATDQRFSMIISNNSGCGGAALSRRRFGETVGRINTSFPHWFSESFRQYNRREDELPVDQHQLLATLAPRPLYIASGEDDKWADPRGEFLGGVEASPVYELYQKTGIPTTEFPPVNQPVMGHIGYHIRNGGHGLLGYDWQQFLKFADMHWR
ncbi:alpha/beta hydrolase family protein [Lunatibacter salilacus]|uniref:alpha/beta hydrolase family protein n=1 Tax=Lunatibacter salilacus TaxID=2483804 RepID=UPI00131C55DE|nr:acetylxylan esterase [Lunatibacter salilacus]